MDISIAPKSFLTPLDNPFCIPLPANTHSPGNQWSVLRVSLHFTEFYINGIIQYALFKIWLLSLSIIVLQFIHVCINSSFLFYCWQYFIELDTPQFAMHSPADGHFQRLPKKLLWTFMYKSLGICFHLSWVNIIQ